MHPKHHPTTACSRLTRTENHKLCIRPSREQASTNDTSDLDRLTPVLQLEQAQAVAGSRPKPSLGRRERLNAATRGRLHGLDPSPLGRSRVSASLQGKLTSVALCSCLCLLATGCVPSQATRSDETAAMPNPMLNASYSQDADVAFVAKPTMAVARKLNKVDFASESASHRTREMAHWIVSSKDNLNMPFAIVDKVNAKVYVFGADGEFHGAAPVLLGLAKGDYSPPDVGDKPMSLIPPDQRTTPAGRFVSTMGLNHKGKEILWLDYGQALSMHAVVKGTARDRRAERLASATPSDNRISFGCINVPEDFFYDVVRNKFSVKGGVVYVLPETAGFKPS